MKILILGASGMVGKKLSDRLVASPLPDDQILTSLVMADQVCPAPLNTRLPHLTNAGPQAPTIESIKSDLTDMDDMSELIAALPDVIFHLAAVVSGEAERDMGKGYQVNLDGMRNLLNAIHNEHQRSGYSPRLIFSSSIAVYGAPFPESISDDFHLTPMTSYGTQKAICEMLLADYHRRGIVTGVGLRFPTLCVRPGAANQAASSFFSNIIREPINGNRAVLPVDPDVRHWFASPRNSIDFLLHAMSLTRENIGANCNMNLPGLCVSVAEQIESLERMVGSNARSLIEHRPDPDIQAIVRNWPFSFSPERAISLGFRAEQSFDDLITAYLEDDYCPNQS